MSHRLKLVTISFVLAIFLSFSPSASADIVFTFTQSLTGGVDVVGIGSGFSTVDTTSFDFDSQDYNTDFLADTFSASITPATITMGTLTNTTTGVSEVITGFRVDRDVTTADDIDFQTANAMIFTAGDGFAMSLNASFDFGTLPFSELIVGTHTEDGGGFPDENFGQYTVIVVPEPGSFAFLTIAFMGIGLRRRSF